MTQTIVLLALMAAMSALIFPIGAAQLHAWRLKADGRVARTVPDLFVWWNGFASIGRLYSDTHSAYRSAFISRCVTVTRVALPLALALFVLNMIVMMTGSSG